jgi:hypothetical protein
MKDSTLNNILESFMLDGLAPIIAVLMVGLLPTVAFALYSIQLAEAPEPFNVYAQQANGKLFIINLLTLSSGCFISAMLVLKRFRDFDGQNIGIFVTLALVTITLTGFLFVAILFNLDDSILIDSAFMPEKFAMLVFSVPFSIFCGVLFSMLVCTKNKT